MVPNRQQAIGNYNSDHGVTDKRCIILCSINISFYSYLTHKQLETHGCALSTHNERDGVSNYRRLDCLLNPADQRQHQRSASRAFMRGIHRWSVDLHHKGSVTRKMLPFDDVITWKNVACRTVSAVSKGGQQTYTDRQTHGEKKKDNHHNSFGPKGIVINDTFNSMRPNLDSNTMRLIYWWCTWYTQ